jgi:hypothetical protein
MSLVCEKMGTVLEGATAATSGLTAKSGRGYTAVAPEAAILREARRVFAARRCEHADDAFIKIEHLFLKRRSRRLAQHPTSARVSLAREPSSSVSSPRGGPHAGHPARRPGAEGDGPFQRRRPLRRAAMVKRGGRAHAPQQIRREHAAGHLRHQDDGSPLDLPAPAGLQSRHDSSFHGTGSWR